jgi:lysophospholipase L1-like esterase
MTRRDLFTPMILATAVLLAWGLVPGEMASGMPLRVREVLRNGQRNQADYERMEQGYYEQILDAGRTLDSPIGVLDGALPGHAETIQVEHGRLAMSVDDIREYVLKPNLSRDTGRDIPWSTNRHGMRDRDYPEAKPRGTFRIALVGDSIASGWGVEDSEGFEPRLERALDARSRSAHGPAVEVLNFAVPGHGPGQRWCHFARVGWAFDPELVLFEATPADLGWDERRLRGLLARGLGFDADVYRKVLTAAGVKPGLSSTAYKAILRPLRWELLGGVYRAAAADCRARGVPIVLVLIPRVGKPIDPAERRRLVALAHASGFTAVIDACNVYDGIDPRDLALSPDDFHPNPDGHARIAQALEAALTTRPALSSLWQAPRQDNTVIRASADAGVTAEAEGTRQQ